MSNSKGSMKTYRAALVGCGGRGISMAEVAEKYGQFQVVGVADPLEANRTEAMRKLKQTEVKSFADLSSLLKWGEFDVAFITSPDFAHEKQAIACMQAGKDLFLEKPIAISVAGGKRVVETAKKTKRVVIVGFVLRYTPLFSKAKALVDSGLIGDLKSMWVLHSVGSGSDWYFHDWHATFKNTGGLLLQKGSHDFDIINWFAGSKASQVSAIGSQDFFGGNKPNSLTCPECPERLTCSESMPENFPRVKCVFRKETDCLDNHLVQIQYANGIKVSYTECHYTPDDNREYIFIGTKGKLKLDWDLGKIVVWTRPGVHKRDYMEYSPGNVDGGHGGGDPRLFADLVKSIESRQQPLAGVQAGFDAIQLGLLSHESIRKGGKVIKVS